MVSKKDKYLAAAQKFIERGQLDKALAEYNKVVQEDAKDSRTWLKMAELHAKRGANAEASDIYLRTGDMYVEQGFAQKAVAVYKNVLKLSPGTVAAHLKMAALFNQLGLVTDAVQQFEAGAMALQRANKNADAVAALRQATEIQPDNVVLRVKLAESASHAGLVDEAVREFARAAEQLKVQGRIDESLRVLERLLFHQPDNFAKARELAESYIAKGAPRSALPKLQACLNGDPRDPRILSLLAKALEQLGEKAKAISVLKELVRLCEELERSSERDAAILRGLTLDSADGELVALGARHQVRAAGGAKVSEVTPPPRTMFPSPGGDGEAFDDSGVVSMPSSLLSSGPSADVVSFGSGRDNGAGRGGDSSGISLGEAPEVSRIIAEAEVFVKYGLLERAADHLPRVFEYDPGQRVAREKLIAVLDRLGRREDASHHRALLAQQSTAAAQDDSDGPDVGSISLTPELATAETLSAADDVSPAPNRSLAVDSDDIDASDPAADVMTPPPEIWPASFAGSGASMDSSQRLSTEFDSEVLTGDVVVVSSSLELDSEVEFSIDVASEDSVPQAAGQTRSMDVDSEAVTPAPTPDVHQGAGADADTPPLVRTPMVIAALPGAITGVDAFRDDEEDPASAFSEDVATVAGDADGIAAAFVAFEEDELIAELEQVSFFLDQGMSDEARSVLQDLEGRFPGHAHIAAKLREVRLLEKKAATQRSDSVTTSRITASPTLGSTFIERPARSDHGTPTPRAVVSGGEKSDFSTHADLAIAYKGMGLFDAAIGELKLLAQDEEQEVFALTTMGECYEAKSSFTEAIIRYKRALNCEQITREETLLLYSLLGAAFERLGDVSEALYFFEKVLKRDPKFRDVDLKVAELRPRLVKRAR